MLLLLAFGLVAGCASVPDTSPVQVLRQLGSDDPAKVVGPVDGSNVLDLVRDFVTASGSSTDKHAAARAFLAPEAEGWNDAAGVTVLDGQIDTVPAPGAADASRGATTIRIRGTEIGTVTPAGSFEPAQSSWYLDVDVVRRGGQWRISRLPDGVVVPLSVFQVDYRTVRTWFVDPSRRLAVADQRYVPSVPATAQAARVMELLLAGPSGALLAAATSQLAPTAKLRSNLAVAPDGGALVVDLKETGDLDATARRLLVTQVVLSLAEVNVGRVRLLIDGEPVLPERTDWTRDDVIALSAEVQPSADVPALVVAGGRISQFTGAATPTPLPAALGNGEIDAESAASTVDGQHLAVVTRVPAGRALLVSSGPDRGVAPVALSGRTMTRPSWTPTGNEVWTVLNGGTVARVMIDTNGQVRTGQVNADELAAFGPITDLRLSRDGMRVAAVVGGGLYTAAVARTIDGEVALRNVRRLRPADLGEVAGVDWRSGETLAVITRGTSPVQQVSVDGLTLTSVLGSNLTPPLTSVAAAPSRALLVTDQGGVWSFAGGDQDAWRPVAGGGPGAVPVYPG